MPHRAFHFVGVGALAVFVLCGCSSGPKSREVLLRQDGQDRHWVVRSHGLIVEEHYLTAHGDLPVVIEYAKGVRTPQVDSQQKEKAGVSRVKMFWPKGQMMSETSALNGEAHGPDRIWWEGGKLAREAVFEHGEPVGVWRFYRPTGEFLGQGTFKDGKRRGGVFVGLDNPGGDFFFGHKMQVFENGKMIREEDFDGR